MTKRIISLLMLTFFVFALTSCSFSLKYKMDEDFEKPDTPSTPIEEKKEDFRLVVYYLDQKDVYEGLEAGSTINLNNYIPKVNGYEFKGWYFNKDYSFKYSDERLSIKLEDYTELEDGWCDYETIFNRTVYAYAKLLLPGEEDIMPEHGWGHTGYHGKVLVIYDKIPPSQLENSLRYFNFSLDVKKENNVFVGDSNLEATYFFQTVDYTEQLNYSDHENITINQDGEEYTCFTAQPFKYNIFEFYSKEEYDNIWGNQPTYGWCKEQTIIKNIIFSKDNNDVSIKMDVNVGSYVELYVELYITNNQLTMITSLKYEDRDMNGCRIYTYVQDRTVIENFDLNPEFTYDTNGEVIGIKINKTYQE